MEDRGLDERYVDLGLRLGRHVEGFVDSYYGPAELREAADAGDPAPPSELREHAGRLLAEIDADGGLEPQRRKWLRAQVAACEALARRLDGEQSSWSDEVEQLFGVRPMAVDDAEIAKAHQDLDEALPGTGDVGERYRAWVERQYVPREKLLEAVRRMAELARERGRELAPLPADEDYELELVGNEPWSAYNYYLGGCRSRVVVNGVAPLTVGFLLELATHELYPGHHTEHACKEALLWREHGYLEETIALVLTPQALVAEGIATLAVEMAFGDEAYAAAAEALEPLGVAYDHETAAAIRGAAEAIGTLGVNGAYRLHEYGEPRDAVRDYLLETTLRALDRVDHMLAFIEDPVWRSYISTYTDGVRLARTYVGGDPARFVTLLTEQVTPQDLVA